MSSAPENPSDSQPKPPSEAPHFEITLTGPLSNSDLQESTNEAMDLTESLPAKRGRPRKPKPVPTDPVVFSLAGTSMINTSLALQDASSVDEEQSTKKRRVTKPRKSLYQDSVTLQFHQFTEQEDAQLANALQHHLAANVTEDALPWDAIAASLGVPAITPDDCKHRWSVMRAKKATHNPLAISDATLRNAVEQHTDANGNIAWETIAEALGDGRAVAELKQQWNALQQARPEGNTGAWTQPEDELLQAAVELYAGRGPRGGIAWDHVAAHIGHIRTAKQCSKRWLKTLQPKLNGARTGPWSEEEFEKLREGVALYQGQGKKGAIQWQRVADHMGGVRSAHQCTMRWLQSEVHKKEGVKSGPWSQEEAALLQEAVEKYGPTDWKVIAEHMGNTRTPDQCSHRWNKILKPRITGARTGAWTEEEDMQLQAAVSMFEGQGRDGAVDWLLVVEMLGGTRSAQQCSNRWNKTLRPKRDGASTGAWTEEEDTRLMEAMELYDGQGPGGVPDWKRIVEHVKTRSTNQCTVRWNSSLKPKILGIKAGAWTAEEDRKLAEAANFYAGQGLNGSVDWAKVAQYMGGIKTVKQCSSRWGNINRSSKKAARRSGQQMAPIAEAPVDVTSL